MKVDGHCHCGAISFEAEVDPARVYVCHCADCQVLTGSAYRVNVLADGATFRVSGAATEYVKTADSGNRRVQAFCPTCGTPVYSTTAENRQVYSLRVGTLRQRASLPPRARIWCKSALAWSTNLEQVPASDTQ
jgi:hypothetical protein